MRRPRQGRLLVGGVLGRCHLRLLHPLSQRRPLGAAPHLPAADAQLAPADAAARPEPARLSPLRGLRRRSLRREVCRERHGRLPCLRCAERHPQPEAPHRGRAPDRQARSGDHLLHDQPAARHGALRRHGEEAGRPRRRLAVHQGHGGPAQAAARLRHRQGHQGGVWCRHPRPRARACDDGRDDGEPDEGHRGRRRLCRHGDQLDQSGPWSQSDRESRRDARWHGLRHPGGSRPAAVAEEVLRHGPSPLQRVPVEHHRCGDRDLPESDPGRHDLQHGEPVEAAGRWRQDGRGAGRSAARAQGRRLSAAGHPVEPDRRNAGRLQRDDGALQGADGRVRRPDARLLRAHHRRARPRGHRPGRGAGEEAGDHRAPRRSAAAGMAAPA